MLTRINELFRSIQGEGVHAGRTMQFVRFFGCNLSCVWCDQPSALEDRPMHHSRDMDTGEIAQIVCENHVSVPVCFTGGEPTVQHQALLKLMDEIRERDLGAYIMRQHAEPNKDDLDGPARLFTIESNGMIFLPEIVNNMHNVFMSLSPKFLGTEVNGAISAHGESDIVKWIESGVSLQLKFVVENERRFDQILAWACKAVKKNRGRIPLVFQPEWYKGKDDFKKILARFADPDAYRQLAELGFQKVLFQGQAHKFIGIR